MKQEMESALSSSEIFSHPGKLLTAHLLRVAESCLKKFREDQSNFDLYFSRNHWENLIWFMGFFHDSGKTTRNFQEYLREEDEKKKQAMKASPLTSHSLISAVMAHFWLSGYIEKYRQKNDNHIWLG